MDRRLPTVESYVLHMIQPQRALQCRFAGEKSYSMFTFHSIRTRFTSNPTYMKRFYIVAASPIAYSNVLYQTSS